MTGPGADVRRHPTAGRPRILQPVPALEPPITERKGEPGPPCKHRGIELVLDERRVRCQQCEQWIDPFEYLLVQARDWNHYRWRHREAEAAVRAAAQEAVRLEKANARLKGQIGRGRAVEKREALAAVTVARRSLTKLGRALVALGVARDGDAFHVLWPARSELARLARDLADPLEPPSA